MKNRMQNLFVALVLLSALNLQPSTAFAQGTAFAYQGRLNNNGSPAAGTYNLTFALFNTNITGVPIAGPVTNNAVFVTNGLFTVLIDFGPGVFTGATNWLQIGVATNGVGSFTTLTPRQELTPTPYAIYAENVSAAGISGTIQPASLGGTYGNTITLSNAGNSFSGNGAGLTGVNAAALNGLNASNFWRTTGNAGTSPANGNFVGTTDNQPLELRVNGERALRLEPTATNGSINIIGGLENFVVPGKVGSVIAGGGRQDNNGFSETNSIAGNYAFIGGGSGNAINTDANYSAIVSGTSSFIDVNSYNSAIVAGEQNTIGEGTDHSFIGGGLDNSIFLFSGTADIIGGGENNSINGPSIHDSVISGGNGNQVQGNSDTIGGGTLNFATNSYSTVSGGFGNTASGQSATVAGGGQLVVLTSGKAKPLAGGSGGGGNTASGDYSSIGGGRRNTASGYASTIAGGDGNTASLDDAAIGGGWGNIAQNDDATVSGGDNNNAGGYGSVVSGGEQNAANGDHSAVGGGQNNMAFGAADTLAGGQNNSSGGGNVSTISGGEDNNSSGSDAVIGGGMNNSVSAFYSTVGGGVNNTATNMSAVVSGGTNNVSGGYASTVGGGQENGATGDWSTVSGGWRNLAPGDSATVGGGYGNSAVDSATVAGGRGNAASDYVTTVAGGLGNQSLIYGSAVGGGLDNSASGYAATIPGGVSNVASGSYAFAAGQQAQATNNGAFVWADASGYRFSSTTINEFSARATGGVRFVTAVNGSGNPTAGVALSPGATSWATLSDRNAKKDFAAVDTGAVLDKLAAVPVEQWHYKWEAADSTPNLGPMAQDFIHAFYPGRNDKSITTLEFDGVELAAIQGLNQKLNEKDAQIQELKQRLEALEKIVLNQKSN